MTELVLNDPVLLEQQNNSNKQSVIKYLQTIIDDLEKKETALVDFKCKFTNKTEEIIYDTIALDLQLVGKQITFTVDYNL